MHCDERWFDEASMYISMAGPAAERKLTGRWPELLTGMQSDYAAEENAARRIHGFQLMDDHERSILRAYQRYTRGRITGMIEADWSLITAIADSLKDTAELSLAEVQGIKHRVLASPAQAA